MAKTKESSWGGRRPGAGRKPRSLHYVIHGKRPKVDPDHPLLVTKRVMDDFELEDADTWSIIRQAVAESVEATPGFDVEKLTHEGLELLLLVNAKNKKALTRGIQGLSVRIAHRLNRLYERTGRVFVARYEAEPLDNKRAVDRALARF